MRAQLFLVWLAVFGLACGDDANNERDAAAASDAGVGDDDGGAGGKSDAGEQTDPMTSAMIGPQGGEISSSDGKVKLTIPKGALKDNQLISIEKLAKGESRALLADANELVSYRFAPDGLVFDEPLLLDVELPKLIAPTADAAKAVVPLVFASTVSKDTLEYVSKHELTVNLDSGDAVLRNELKHFSDYSSQWWTPTNKLESSYFYFEASPLPPPKMELSKKYGVGLSFWVRRFLSKALGLHYRDMSRGLVYSGSKGTVDIGKIPGADDKPSSFVVDVGDYGCSKLGPATFEAKLTSDSFIPTPDPDFECEGGDDQVHCLAVMTGPIAYSVSLKRKVECIADKPVKPATDGAPFSGFVAYTRSDRGTMDLKGAFYDGGADQAKFDAYVMTQRRRLGIMPDRGANGTCRPVDVDLYDPNILNEGAAIDFSHVGTGDDDAIRIDFMSSPNEPPYLSTYQEVFGTYDSTFIFDDAFTDKGLAVHIPASSNTPTIVLPSWDPYTYYGKPTYAPGYLLTPVSNGADLTVTWKAEEIGGDFIHVWGAGSDPDSTEVRAFECFISVEDQLLTIPAETITGLYTDTPIDPLWLHIYLNWGSHTTATYKGKTLDGYNIREYYSAEMTDDPNNPDD